MDNNKRNEILCYTQGVNITNFFVFEMIPPDKLNNAINSYAPIQSGEETVIFLYDDTMFGSAKDGFLLTTKRLYQKNMSENGSFVGIDSITDMKIKRGLPAKLSVCTDKGSLDIEITHITGKSMRSFFLNILKKTLVTLEASAFGTTSGANTQSQQVVECQGCGARYHCYKRRCDYCNSPL